MRRRRAADLAEAVRATPGAVHLHQFAQGFQIAAGLAAQRRHVAGIELAGHPVLPVLRGLVPGVIEQAELLIAVPVRSGNHGRVTTVG